MLQAKCYKSVLFCNTQMEQIKCVTNICPLVTQNNVIVHVLQRNIYIWTFQFIGDMDIAPRCR